MNKTAIKNFAIWARNKLIADITYKAGLLGISEKATKSPLPQSTKDVQFFDIGTKDPYTITGIEIEQRRKLAELIETKAKGSDYKTAYKAVVEEVAYTWFNRLIAIRFMEVNDYLPSRVRVLSSEAVGKSEPDLVTNPFDTDLEFTQAEKDRILELKHENKLDELFRMLFIKKCNALNAILPELFEKTSDYTELLLNVAFTDKDGVVYHLVNDIEVDDFKDAVEIIGWMYQYYNEERKNEVINIYKGTIKKEDIPAATQLFTTDWVVRYMVDNSLGRYWIERNPQSKLKEKLEYFVTPKDGLIQFVDEKITPEELTFFDPCMGSGHILVYAFDVLMEIYKELGYADRDAAQTIIERNIFGLDIDDRAYQLAYFAVMMKARSYDRRFLTRAIAPNIAAIQETNNLSQFFNAGITKDTKQNKIGEYLISAYQHAKEIGSLLSVEKHDYKSFIEYLNECSFFGQITIESDHWLRSIAPLMKQIAKQASIMSDKYAIVCTNPPYMNKLEGQLKKYVLLEYKPYGGDLFSIFMYRNFDYCRENGYSAFMTPFVWMFIKTYEQLRRYIIQHKSITTLVQMEYSAFEEATVPICSFVLKNGKEKAKGLYFKLSEYKGGMEVQRKKVLDAIINTDCGYFFETSEVNFTKISGSPIAYWVGNKLLSAFETGARLGDISKPRQGMATTNNERFLRLWHEVDYSNIGFGLYCIEDTVGRIKWFPYNKGGDFRKWYGNNDYIVNFKDKGAEVCKYIDETSAVNSKGRVINREHYFHECISWSLISSSSIAFRYKPNGFIFDVAGMSCFAEKGILLYLLGLSNTNVVRTVMQTLAPTINYQVGDIANIPVIISEKQRQRVIDIVVENIAIEKEEWDSFEISWDFAVHPLIRFRNHQEDVDRDSQCKLDNAFLYWQAKVANDFDKVKYNEEVLNSIFIEIYGLEKEISAYVEDKDITLRKADLSRDIKSLISYSVGCMFGRYSLDVKGVAYAGDSWNTNKYKAFIPDCDNCIPITDEEYFGDDIVGRFVEFVKCVYGPDTLEENLDFIAKALYNKGNTSREIIRNYFLKDFFKDHCKTYQKRPIYWLYDSGKQDGFKALVYMHRYTEDTTGVVRADYLHKLQKVYEREMVHMQEVIDNSTNAREAAAAQKRKDRLAKQLKETKEYDEKIAHLALARISIDLDDGVKVNYEKVQTDADGNKLEVLAKI